MWPFKKKTDKQLLEADVSFFCYMVECEKMAVAAHERELAFAKAKLADYEGWVRMGEKILANWIEPEVRP